MNDHIGVLLSAWGRREHHRISGGLGYPSVSPMFMGCKFVQEEREKKYASLVSHTDIDDTEKAVDRLQPEERALCVQFYVIGGKGEAISQRVGLSKSRMYARIDLVKRQVIGHLNDISVGL